MTSTHLAITHPPKHGQLICHNDQDYDTIKEGLAYILAPQIAPQPPKKSKNKEDRENGAPQTVFYNPIQQFNRDLSVLAIKAFGEEAVRVKKELWEKRRGIFEGRKHGKKRKRGEGVIEGAVRAVNGNAEGLNEQEGPASDRKKDDVEGDTVTETTNGVKEPIVALEGGGGTKRKRTEEDESTLEANVVSEAGAGAGEDRGKKRKIIGSKTFNGEWNGQGDPGVSSEETQPGPTVADARSDQDTSTNAAPMANLGPVMQAINGTDSVLENKDSAANIDKDNPKPFQTSFTVLDALSATGLRALRYAKELPFVTSILANDMSPKATKAIELNVQHNKVESKVTAHTGDARAFMYNIAGPHQVEIPERSGRYFGKFDVIDLDPYGTAAPFFDAAVQAVTDGGLLCITCTDAGVFASSGYPEKTYSLYGGLPLKGPQSHEAGLRLILNSIASSAARYGASIEPLISLSIDFYARLFVRVHRSPSQTKFLAGKTMLVYSCDNGCGAWTTQLLGRNKEQKGKDGSTFWKYSNSQGPSTTPNCEHCGFKMHIAGPMWAGPLHSPHFIQSILDILPTVDKEIYPTLSRIEGMLSTALEEDLDLQGTEDSKYPDPVGPRNVAKLDHHPFFIIPNVLCKVIHCQTPDEDSLRGALRHLGYRFSRSHTKAGSIKTDAPWSALWEIIREWARQKSPIRADAIKEGTAGWGILQQGRELSRMDKLESMKAQLLSAMAKSKDAETLKTEVEAAMYRASREVNGVSSNGVSTEAGTEADDGDSEDGKGKKNQVIPPSKLNVVFDQKLGRQRNTKKLVRYQMNPRADWGPMNRAKGGSG